MKPLLFAVLLTLSSSAHALFISDYFHDTDTGLDWLHGSQTLGLSYIEAGNRFDQLAGGGWRYASSGEVRHLFGRVFENFVPNRPGNTARRIPGISYPEHLFESGRFSALFGSVPDVDRPEISYSYGMFSATDSLDPAGLVNITGTLNAPFVNDIYGPYGRPQIAAAQGQYLTFTLAVRDTTVPEPGISGLLGVGLLLIGVAAKIRS